MAFRKTGLKKNLRLEFKGRYKRLGQMCQETIEYDKIKKKQGVTSHPCVTFSNKGKSLWSVALRIRWTDYKSEILHIHPKNRRTLSRKLEYGRTGQLPEKKANVRCSCDENRKLTRMLQMWPFYYNWTTFSHKMKIKNMAENTFFLYLNWLCQELSETLVHLCSPWSG